MAMPHTMEEDEGWHLNQLQPPEAYQFKLAISEAKSAISLSTNEITEEDTSSSISVPGTTPTSTIAEASEHKLSQNENRLGTT